jgi:uncharacterized membrane protein
MPYCTQCRTAVDADDKFCPACGAPVKVPLVVDSSTTSTDATPPSPPPAMPPAPAAIPATSASLSPEGAAVLCYAFGFVSGIILLNLQPWSRDRMIRFHAFQSIFFNVAWAVIWVAAAILGFILGVASPMDGGLVMLLQLIVWGGGVALWIVLMVKSFKGQRLELPIIGRWAERAASSSTPQ